MEAEVRDATRRLAGRAGDEDAAFAAALVKRDGSAVRRKRRRGLAAIGFPGDQNRVAAANALHIDVRLAAGQARERDGGAVRRNGRIRLHARLVCDLLERQRQGGRRHRTWREGAAGKERGGDENQHRRDGHDRQAARGHVR